MCPQGSDSKQFHSTSHTKNTENVFGNADRKLRISSATFLRSFISLTMHDYKYLAV